MHLLWSLGLKRRKFSTSTPALLPVANTLQPSASPPPLPASHSEELPGPREQEPTAVTSAPATPAFYLTHLKRSSCIVSSSSSLQDDAEESSSSTTTTTMTSTRNVLEEGWPQDDDEETPDQPEIIKGVEETNEAEDEEDAEAVAAGRRGEERRERKKQLKRERREKRERKREEKKMEKKTNNRGREEEDAEKRALREAEEAEEDMRVLLAACQLQGETRNQTAFACSGRTKDQKKAKSDKKKKKGGKEKSPEPKVKKSRRERKLEKREHKKDKKQRKIDKELQKQREKEEKRRSRNRGHARSSSDGAALASSNINSSAAGLSSSASMPSITSKPRKSWRPSTWRMSSIACLGRTPSMDGEDSPLQTSDSHSLDGPRGDKGSTSRRRSSIEKGKDKQRDHEEDDDPDKKSGPGKVLEEGTMEPCGEDGEDEGWSEESVEWCGVKYAKNDMPPFDTSGLRGKTAYNPNHCLWLATAAALAYRSPAQIRHVVTRIWEWEDMEFFHNAETDTQGFGAYGKDCIVICFRGTESSRDWSININISETEPFPDMPAVKVHNGFNRALTSVLEQVVDFIAKGLEFDPSLPLYITGHSLGGALANMCLAYFTFPSSPFLLKTLACADTSTSSGSSSSCDETQVAASRREPLIKGVYTFGQPKVGNEQFAYELRVHSVGTVFFRLTNNNDLVPFVPRRLYVHCGTRLFLSEAGHIVQGDEAARPAREFWRENNHGRMFKRKRQGFRDHLVKSYVTFVREHYRINEAILMSPLRKDMPLLRFHDMERAKLSCEEMRQLVSFDSVIEGLKHMTVSDLMDTRSLAMTAKQRKKEAQTLGRKWLREQLWEKLKDNEDQQIKKYYKALKCEVEKKKAKYRGDSAKLDKQQPNDSSSSSSGDAPPPAVAKDGGGKSNGPIGAIFASFSSLKDALRADS